MNKKATIVLSCDNNYVKYTFMTMFSLATNKKTDRLYKIYVLISPDVTEENISLLKSLERDDLEIVCQIVEQEFEKENVQEHLAIPSYYRLLVAELIEDGGVCLYLDSDIIIEDDISELFDVDMNNLYIAGVKQIGYRLAADGGKSFCKTWGITGIDYYVNAGVLLMNLDYIKEDSLTEKFLEMTDRKWPGQDQFILNYVCYGKIGFIPYKYNIGTPGYIKKKNICKVFTNEEIDEAYKRPCILHFAEEKPWKNINAPFADRWWDYAKKSPLYLEFCKELVEYSLRPRYAVFPQEANLDAFLSFLRGKNVIIYGAGQVAKYCCEILKSRNIYPSFFAVTNRENNVAQINGIEVEEISELEKYKNNFIVLIATSECYKKEISEKLNAMKFEYYEMRSEWMEDYRSRHE